MVRSYEENGCGSAAVRNFLLRTGRSRDERMILTDPCEDFAGMKKALGDYGIEARGYQGASLEDLSRLTLPLIVQVRLGSRLHFLLLTGIKKRKVLLTDSRYGSFSLSNKEFSSIFTGYVLSGEERERTKQKGKRTKLSFLSFSEKVCYLSLFVLELFSFLGLFYTLPREDGFLPSLLLFLVSGLLLLFQFLLNHSVRKRLDRDYLVPYLEKTRKKEDYPRLSRALNEMVLAPSTLLTQGVALCLLLFLSLGRLPFGPVVLSSALLFPLLSLAFRRWVNRSSFLAEKEEKESLAALYGGAPFGPGYSRSYQRAIEAEEGSLFPLLVAGMAGIALLLLETFLSGPRNLSLFLGGAFLFLAAGEVFLKLLSTLERRSLRVSLLNALSAPIPPLSREKRPRFGYTNPKREEFPEGEGRNGGYTCSGLPRQDPAEEESSSSLSDGLRPRPEGPGEDRVL